MKKLVLYICIFLSSITLYAQSGKVKQADKLFNKFSYTKAIKLYKSALQKKPNNLHIHKKLGDCYMLLRQPQKAAPHYKNVVEESTVDPYYYYAYAQALRASGEYKQSKKWMRKFKATGVVDSRVDQFFNNLDFIDVLHKKENRYTIKNSPLNTKNSDFGAVKHNGNTYFVSAREDKDAHVKRVYNWNDQPFLDIFKVSDTSDVVIRMVDGVNTKFHEGAACFTPNGKHMYFTRNNFIDNKAIKDDQGTNNLKIFQAEWIDGQWQNSKPLFFSSDSYSVGHPTVSADGKKLFFTSDMPGGFGGSDIYVSEIHDRGGVKKPLNLGETINTEGNEMFPFYHALENKLYFSSEGHLGLGQLDIFVAEKIEGKYQNVTNLGEPINSISDDFAYNLNKYGSKGFISSNRKGGVGDDDIYTFTRFREFTMKGIVTDKFTNEPLENTTVILTDQEGKVLFEIQTKDDGYYEKLIPRDKHYQLNADKLKFENKIKVFNSLNQEAYTEMIVNLELDPINNFIVKGFIKDKVTKQPLENTKVILRDSEGKIVLELQTKENGYYEKLIDRDKHYQLNADKQKFESNMISFDSFNQEVNTEMIVNLELDPLKDMNVLAGLSTDTIFFHFDSCVIRDDAKPELDKIVAVMNKYTDMVIHIESHTDSRGSAKYNEKLSERRAKSTYDYFIQQGVKVERITSHKGYGEYKLTNDCGDGVNCDDDQHQANRRTEFVIEKII